MSSLPPYYSTLNIVESSSIFVFRMISFLVVSRILHSIWRQKSLAKEISPTLSMELAFLWTFPLLTAPYLLYVIGQSFGILLQTPYLLYWLGVLCSIAFYVSSIPVIFLSLDRCLMIGLGAKYTPTLQWRLVFAEILCLAVVYLINLIYLFMELPLDTEKGVEIYFGKNLWASFVCRIAKNSNPFLIFLSTYFLV